jgi:hypothetical protein
LGAGQSPSGARAVVGPGQRGISNTLGQNTQIPLEQTFAGSESLGRFNGSANFTETQFPINPGQAGTFPWLSQEAKLWEKYEFDSLKFEFRTTINEFSANALGRVILGVDFDASDPPPSSRSQAEISRPVTAQAPYFNQMLTLRKQDMHDSMKRHYVRPGALPGGADIKMYDVGNLNFGTDGNINANEVGELWVHYTGKFHVQVLEALTVAPNNNQVALFSGTAEAQTSSVARTMLLATSVANGVGAVNTAGSILLPEGNFLVDFTARVDSTAAITSFSATLQVNGAPAGTQAAIVLGAAAVGVTLTVGDTWFFQSNGANPLTLSLNTTSTGTITGTAQMRITAV